MKPAILARFAARALAAGLFAALPGAAAGQDPARVYGAAELTAPTKVKAPAAAADAIQRSYPSGLRSVGGRVQLQFIVQPNGRVDPESIEVLVATATRLGEAAIRAVQQIEFQPGEVNGVPVRALVQFPITFAAR
jgi:periplasmic protein TonB